MAEMDASQQVPGKPACYAVADCLFTAALDPDYARVGSACLSRVGSSVMSDSKTAAYRRFTRECLQLAEAASVEHRPLLIEMAQSWHQLAQEQEQAKWAPVLADAEA